MFKLTSCLLSVLFFCFTLTACESGPEKPQQQKDFALKLKETGEAYEQGETDAQKTLAQQKAKAERDAFFNSLGKSPTFNNWVCKVDDVSIKGGTDDLFTKSTIAIVSLDCDGFGMENMDITTFEGVPSNAIIKGNALFETAIALNPNDVVLASGNFMMTTNDSKIWESSLTEDGGMSDPEFVVHFSEIKPVE